DTAFAAHQVRFGTQFKERDDWPRPAISRLSLFSHTPPPGASIFAEKGETCAAGRKSWPAAHRIERSVPQPADKRQPAGPRVLPSFLFLVAACRRDATLPLPEVSIVALESGCPAANEYARVDRTIEGRIMKLLSFQTDGAARVGAALSDGIVDLTRALRATHPDLKCADSLLAIIQSGIDIDSIGDESVARLKKDGKL